MPQFVLAHLSDVHLQPPPGSWTGGVLSKRLFSRLSWLRARRLSHRPEVLQAIVDDLRAQGADHLAITGDLINFAAPAEFAAARRWLEALGPPGDVTVSLGNHDLLVATPGPGGPQSWADWLSDEPGWPVFPTVRIRNGVALVNLCSAVPTPVFSAAGRLGEAQLGRAAAVLAELGARSLFRIVLVHHPVADVGMSERKQLKDAAGLRAVLQRAGAELILHGHGHETVVSSVQGPCGPIPALGVPSASSAPGRGHAPARWRRIEIDDPADCAWITVRDRGLDGRGGGVKALGAYRLAAPRRGRGSGRSEGPGVEILAYG